MKKIILLIGIVIILIGCDSKQHSIPTVPTINSTLIKSDISNDSMTSDMNKEEWRDRCWKETMWLCQEHCSNISGLEYTDFLTVDVMQFDQNGDNIVNGSEEREMEYIEWRNDLCMNECIEEEVYDCFK